MIYYSEELNASSSIKKGKSNKWFEENYNKIQRNLDIGLNPGSSDDIQLQDGYYGQPNKQPCQLSYFVFPQLKTLYWIFFLPSAIKYDTEQKIFVNIKPTLLRKVFIILTQVLSILYHWGTLKKIEATTAASNSTGTETLDFMFRVMYISFAYSSATFYYTLHTKGEQIKNLLNNIEPLNIEFQKQSEYQLLSGKINIYVWITNVLFISNGILFATVGGICNGLWNHLISPEKYFNDATNDAVTAFQRIIINDKNYTFNGSDWSFYSKILIGLPYTFICTYSTLSWCLSFQLILLWGFLFRKLLLIFLNGMSRNQNISALEFLRQFHKVSIFIEEFNAAFGMNTFAGILGSIIYMSNQLWSLTSPNDGIDIFVKLILSTVFFMIVAILIVCSEVNSMANRIAFVLKLRFQNEKIWKENHVDNMDEVSQGLSMVYYDLVSNSIGVKGHGFFTITYSFVGSVNTLQIYCELVSKSSNINGSNTCSRVVLCFQVVGIIATYSILFLQFKTSG